MIYLHSIYLNEEEHPQGFPFNIPCIRSLGEMVFKCPVKFLVGEYGSGKSTLLEAIAWSSNPCHWKCGFESG